MKVLSYWKQVINRGAGYELEIPVTYVDADKPVDWAQKNIKKGLQVLKVLKNLQNKNSKKTTLLSYLRFTDFMTDFL